MPFDYKAYVETMYNMPYEEWDRVSSIVREERDLFDLSDWRFTVSYASGKLLEEMEREEEICRVYSEPNSIDFYFNRKSITLPHGLDENLIRVVADHEWGHVILNPYSEYGGGRFRTGMELEESQAAHIAYACEMLRRDDDFEFKVKQPDNLREIIEKAYKLLRLNENNWRIYPRVLKRVEFGGVRLPAFAYSTFYENHSHLWIVKRKRNHARFRP